MYSTIDKWSYPQVPNCVSLQFSYRNTYSYYNYGGVAHGDNAWVQFPPGQSCVTTLGKLFTPMCLCHPVTKQYNLILVEGQCHFSAGNVTADRAESNDSLPLSTGCLPVHQNQLWSQRSETSMGELLPLLQRPECLKVFNRAILTVFETLDTIQTR